SLQGLTEARALHTTEQLADALRRLGPLTRGQVAARAAAELDVEKAAAALIETRRAVRVRIAGTEHLAAIEDAGLHGDAAGGARAGVLRDALGVALPPGIAEAHLSPVDRAVPELISRWARSRGPFLASELIEAFGLAPGVARSALEQLTSERVLQQGEFTPGREGEEWVEAEVLRRIRRATLAASRKDIAPVPQTV